jgi:hypothetical protein
VVEQLQAKGIYLVPEGLGHMPKHPNWLLAIASMISLNYRLEAKQSAHLVALKQKVARHIHLFVRELRLLDPTDSDLARMIRIR